MTQNTTERPLWLRPLIGFLIGFAVTAVDGAAMMWFGIEMTVRAHDVTMGVTLFFASTTGLVGLAAGWWLNQRDQLRAQRDVIQAQVVALQRSQRQLVEHEKLAAVGRLSAGVAHEVRNPLGVIRMSAQMIEEELDPASESAQAAVFIREEVDRLNDLVTRLLDFTRPLQMSPNPLDLETLTARVAALAREELTRREVALEIHAEPITVEADRDLLIQLLLGLVQNAAQACDPAGRVLLRAVRLGDASGASEVLFEVVDDGAGFGADLDPESLFDPFFTTRPEGTGLGLAMARKIAQVHDGTLRALPGEGLGPGGRGACFQLRIPA